MARYTCVKCDHEGHFTEFVSGTNVDGADFDGEDSDGEAGEYADVELTCPACGAGGDSASGGDIYESS